MKKPNVLFITSDQMRYDAIGCNGNERIQTPNLDRLAKQGVNFDNAYTPNPICVPARASITTGCYSHKCTGQKDNDGIIKEGYPILGDELNKRGYKTYAMGKLHYLPYMPPGEKRTTHCIETVEFCESGRITKLYDPEHRLTGVEEYLDYLDDVGWGGFSRGNGLGNNDVYASVSSIPEEHYVDTWVADRAMDYMEKHLEENDDEPFFMWASFPKPHSAYDPPRPYDSMYNPLDMDEAEGTIDFITENGLDFSYMEYKKFMWDKLSPQAKKQIKANYYGLITLQDKQVGRLMDFLEEKGIAEDTIIIYTTDHGDMLGDKGLYFKRIFYNPSVQIPLLISYPRGFKGNRRSKQLVGLQDLLPTLCSFTGLPLEQGIDGIDLRETLIHDEKVRDFYISQTNSSDSNEIDHQSYMITDGIWKYIYNVYGGVEELYNLVDNPDEMRNLLKEKSMDYLKIADEFKRKLRNWCVENEDKEILNENEELIRVDKRDLQVPKHINEFGRRYY